MATASFNPAEPVAKWLNAPAKSDRDMELLEDFVFTDPKGTPWVAPKGSKINGASIPSSLWSTVGSPYTGAYRRASIVHDVACVNAINDAERAKADLMFYDACITGGCSKFQANTLYMGVRVGAWWSPPSSTREFGVRDLSVVKSRGPESDQSLKVFTTVQKKLGDRMATASRAEIDELVSATVAKVQKQESAARGLKLSTKKAATKKPATAKKAALQKVAKKKVAAQN